MADEAKRLALAAILILICVISVVTNVFVFFTCGKRKRLRKPNRYLLISLAVADILAVCLWPSLSVVALFDGSWPDVFSTEICKLQEYFKTLCLMINMHSFGLLAFERCLYIFKPSRHAEIFINTVAVIVIVALWVFDAVMSALPFADWGEVSYFSNQYQCAMDYEKNIRHMNFMTFLTYGLPLFLCLVGYIAIFVRLRKLRKEATQEGGIVLEVDKYATGHSYSHMLKLQQQRFQNAGTRAKKPKIGKKISLTNDGYIDNDSSDEETNKQGAGYVKKEEKKQLKVHYLSKNDLEQTKTYIITTCAYMACWLPYLIVMYVITYDRYHPLADDAVTSFVWLTFCSLFIKPIVYVLHNGYFRTNFKKAFKKEKYQSFDKRPDDAMEAKEESKDIDTQ
ncbi:hypothetical protein FSP39_014957 [Pinctada imbricata]|uniref:G-protein coupled receptors family 1 profile domain-containing protein n=1 Tax=Pinctada imbricata TaxID=66713 RepID=A0AA88YBT2_PINIB|nr:hypothetical protein FSP39_014957 [Pinctada imbricata]